MRHAMADIETLGKKPGCAILSIGAVIFDPHGVDHRETFYLTVDLASQVLAGLKIDPDTVKWWQDKEPAAKEALSVDTVPLLQALTKFAAWLEMHNVTRVWCQGATFDCPILAEAYEIMGIKVPWKFFEVRDTRTVYDLCEFDQYSITREGVFHNALDDAIHQVKCVQAALGKGFCISRAFGQYNTVGSNKNVGL